MARMIAPLTAKQVKDAKAKDRQYKLYDGNGLQLCIHPTGSKVWRFDYHDHNKKRKTYTIGDASLITLAEARLKRDEQTVGKTSKIVVQAHMKLYLWIGMIDGKLM